MVCEAHKTSSYLDQLLSCKKQEVSSTDITNFFAIQKFFENLRMHISFCKIRKRPKSLARSVFFSIDFLCCIPLYKACAKLQVQEYFSVQTFIPLAAKFSIGERDGRVRESEKSIIILIKAKLSKGKFNIPKKVCEIRLLGRCLGAVWN